MSELDEMTTKELIEHEGFRGGLEGAVESLQEEIKSGGNGDELVATTIESFQEAVVQEVRPIAELSALVGELLKEVGGEHGELLSQALGKATEILESAMEWMKGPECAAICRLMLMAYLSGHDPALFSELVKAHPEYLDFSVLE